jgi:hypothetical protein
VDNVRTVLAAFLLEANSLRFMYSEKETPVIPFTLILLYGREREVSMKQFLPGRSKLRSLSDAVKN